MTKITIEGNVYEVKKIISLIKAFLKISNIKETVDNDEYKVVIDADIKQRLYSILEKVKKDNLSEKDITELVHHLSKVQVLPSGKSKICTSNYMRKKEEERLRTKLFIEKLKNDI